MRSRRVEGLWLWVSLQRKVCKQLDIFVFAAENSVQTVTHFNHVNNFVAIKRFCLRAENAIISLYYHSAKSIFR